MNLIPERELINYLTLLLVILFIFFNVLEL